MASPACCVQLPPMPGRNYMSTSDWIEEIAEEKVMPQGQDLSTYANLDMVPHKVTEGLAIEAFRWAAGHSPVQCRLQEGLAVVVHGSVHAQGTCGLRHPPPANPARALHGRRYQRVGGYQLGDTSKLVESLPSSVKRYFGMREERPI